MVHVYAGPGGASVSRVFLLRKIRGDARGLLSTFLGLF